MTRDDAAHMKRRPYPVAMALVAAATGGVAAADVLAAATPVALFVAAVAGSAAYGGFRPGLAAAALAAVVSNYLFISPRYQLSVDANVVGLVAVLLLAVPLTRLVAARPGGAAVGPGRRDVERSVAGCPLFHELSPADLKSLAAAFEVRHVRASQTVYAAGDAGGDLFIIRRGRVELSYELPDGTAVTEAAPGPGGSFGELSLLDGGPRAETARAVTDADLLVLSRAAFRRYLIHHPSAAAAVIAAVARRRRAETGDRPTTEA